MKCSLVLTGVIRLKPASQSAELQHSVVSCEFNMKDLISKDFF
jgi:hypothetical protein